MTDLQNAAYPVGMTKATTRNVINFFPAQPATTMIMLANMIQFIDMIAVTSTITDTSTASIGPPTANSARGLWVVKGTGLMATPFFRSSSI